MKQRVLRIVTGVMLAAAICFVGPIQASADTGTVTFGSESYEYENDEMFPVGVYIKGDETIGTYYVELSYDNRRMEYVSGAESEDNGIITLKGTATGKEVKYMLYFEPLSGGTANIQIERAMVMRAGSNNEAEFQITTLGSAPVKISGEDTVGQTEEPEEPQGTGEEENPQDASEATGSENTGEAPGTASDNLSAEEETLPADTQKDENPIISLVKDYLFIVLFIAILVVVVLIALILRAINIKRRRRRKRERQQNARREAAARNKELFSQEGTSENEKERKPEKSFGRPVISVQNVTMKYKISTNNVSGIKEYVIQKLKGQIRYRELLALDRVSFDVYKGEVVGIIGTNGSGKSTILKIVSGALKPTSGRVRVDKRKIQLLTLGTGFDMELTAKENVYLNGAIIGLTKEFIDEKYDEIVAFAELEGFMDEKVKNFSSGMVSRLGFAIATIGDVAEILILDEVLSVGDEFFRKKSLAKVKEMIHGGATVLIVSHSMSTIIENCTKVVWIEKGKLKMVGDAKEVCAAYNKHGVEVRLNRKVLPEQYVLQYTIESDKKWEISNNKIWKSIEHKGYQVLCANGENSARIFLELDRELQPGNMYGFSIKLQAKSNTKIRFMFAQDTVTNGKFTTVTVEAVSGKWQHLTGEFSCNIKGLKYLMFTSTDFKGQDAMITFDNIFVWKE